MAANEGLERDLLEEVEREFGRPMLVDRIILSLCRVLKRRLGDRDAEDAMKQPAPRPKPDLAVGDVVRMAGFRYAHLLHAPTKYGNWTAYRLAEVPHEGSECYRETTINPGQIVEVYRAGSLLWRLPEPE